MHVWIWRVFRTCVCVCVLICMFSTQVCCRGLVFVSRVHGVFCALMFAVWCVCVSISRCSGVCVMLWITSRPCFRRDHESLSSRGVKPQRRGDCQ